MYVYMYIYIYIYTYIKYIAFNYLTNLLFNFVDGRWRWSQN